MGHIIFHRMAADSIVFNHIATIFCNSLGIWKIQWTNCTNRSTLSRTGNQQNNHLGNSKRYHCLKVNHSSNPIWVSLPRSLERMVVAQPQPPSKGLLPLINMFASHIFLSSPLLPVSSPLFPFYPMWLWTAAPSNYLTPPVFSTLSSSLPYLLLSVYGQTPLYFLLPSTFLTLYMLPSPPFFSILSPPPLSMGNRLSRPRGPSPPLHFSHCGYCFPLLYPFSLPSSPLSMGCCHLPLLLLGDGGYGINGFFMLSIGFECFFSLIYCVEASMKSKNICYLYFYQVRIHRVIRRFKWLHYLLK